jgi:hypothetical protein
MVSLANRCSAMKKIADPISASFYQKNRNKFLNYVSLQHNLKTYWLNVKFLEPWSLMDF